MQSRSFATEIYDFAELAEQVAKFTAMTAEKLRRQESACGQLSVFAWTNRFRQDEQPSKGSSVAVPFETATDSTPEMVKAANRALQEIFVRGCGYKKAGVIASAIIPASEVQTALFDTRDHARQHRLMSAIDSINGSMGRDSIIIASQGFGDIKMRHEHRSPRYTTDWDDLPTVTVK